MHPTIGNESANGIIENASRFIEAETPSPQTAKLNDPEQYMNRLDKIIEPRERLKAFLKSVFVPEFDGSHESFHIYKSALLSGAAGWLFGGILRSRNHHEDFLRKHHASAFTSSHEANRLRVDSFMYSIASRGVKMGVGTFLLVFSTGVISMGSIDYRSRLYMPDWIVGFGTLGAVSRCWLGTRGIIAGGLLGVGAGLFGYGFVRSLEMATGQSVAQWRYMFHEQYMRKREAKREQLIRMSQDNFKEKI